MAEAPLLDVSELQTYFYTDDGVLKAVDRVSFSVRHGETLGVIGESGCGKSITAQSVMRIVPPPGRIVGGSISLNLPDREPMELSRLNRNGKTIRGIRGRHVAMVFQEPMTSLSPVHTIGNQIVEALLLHQTDEDKEAERLALEMLERVGIPKAADRFSAYPHQLSGGLRQRAMIAMALSCHPSLLIADEPTTALDVTIQAQILTLMKELQDQLGMSILFITHDLGVIAEMADTVAVMYLGKVVESGTVAQLFDNPLHPYTRKLLKSIPTVGKKARSRLDAIKGNVPTPIDLPQRCPFFERCPDAMPGTCDRAVPALVEGSDGHATRCFLHNSAVEEPFHG
jgi:oligopeptide/dipeptide ABC transporter ATP-binding protein